MSQEGQLLERKSLRVVVGNSANWTELAKECIAFANATGGVLEIGIEDDAQSPPANQRIPPDLPEQVCRKLAERTVNVQVLPRIVSATDGSQYLELRVSRASAVASTTDGRYFLRVADQSRPITGDDVMRLANERTSLAWETQTTLGMPRKEADPLQRDRVLEALRQSDRVKPSVKEKTDDELLDHYLLAEGTLLTNLGVLCIGSRKQRARLTTAPVIQAVKYDAHGQKVNKLAWDDFSRSPIELIESLWLEIPDFRERYELPDGLYRQEIPAYDEEVIRELLVNALVHRPYTHRGDIFLNLHPDRLEVVNPGPLPLGVTPRNVLHTTVRRNEHLARLFHDLKLMEREGSGFDRIFELLVSQGRPAPEITETHERVQVTVRRRILKPEVIDFVARADQTFQLTQRERIALGLLAQQDAMTARELMEQLELDSVVALAPWTKRLIDWGLVRSTGRTRATRYFVEPSLLRTMEFSGLTTLKRIEPHRLGALLLEDLRRYPGSAISEIHRRVAPELPRSRLKRAVDELIERGEVSYEGERRWRRYRASS